MKQLAYIHLLALSIMLPLTNTAQITAGVAASSVLARPVILADIDLKANFKNNTGNISWHATSQMKVRRYELEKSIDGENYTYVTAFAGTQKQYNTTDNNIFNGTTYYRLKVVGEQNAFYYSNVELIDTKISANEIKVLTTQLQENLFVWIPANVTINSAIISGPDGKLQKKAVVTNKTNLAEIEIKSLPAGIYNLGLLTSKGEMVKLKFSKPA